jgi:hypothetical protein
MPIWQHGETLSLIKKTEEVIELIDSQVDEG